VATIKCPKCEFTMDESGLECPRCGVIFDRYRPDGAHTRTRDSGTAGDIPVNAGPGVFRRVFRVVRWVWAAAAAAALILALCPASPPKIPVTAASIESADTKVAEFQTAMRQGQAETLELDESELNGWLKSNLALQQADSGSKPPHANESDAPALGESGSPPVEDRATAGSSGGGDNPDRPLRDETPASIEKEVAAARSAVRDVRIELRENSLRTFLEFDFHGKSMTFELEGRLSVRDGYLSLEPTSGKLGSLPLLQATLDGAVRKIFESPANREKFRLPAQIRDIRVENHSLVIDPR
jgi:phage FluMu protein Com